MTIVALHFLQRILTTLPRTFSSAIVYLAWQDWHWIFIAGPSFALRASPLVRDVEERDRSRKSASFCCMVSIAGADRSDQAGPGISTPGVRKGVGWRLRPEGRATETKVFAILAPSGAYGSTSARLVRASRRPNARSASWPRFDKRSIQLSSTRCGAVLPAVVRRAPSKRSPQVGQIFPRFGAAALIAIASGPVGGRRRREAGTRLAPSLGQKAIAACSPPALRQTLAAPRGAAFAFAGGRGAATLSS